jgi:hypothetical protein
MERRSNKLIVIDDKDLPQIPRTHVYILLYK